MCSCTGATASHRSWPDTASILSRPLSSCSPGPNVAPSGLPPPPSGQAETGPIVPPGRVGALCPHPRAPARRCTTSLPFQLCGSGLDIPITSPSPAWNTNPPKMKPSVFNFFKSPAERKDRVEALVVEVGASLKLCSELLWAAALRMWGATPSPWSRHPR